MISFDWFLAVGSYLLCLHILLCSFYLSTGNSFLWIHILFPFSETESVSDSQFPFLPSVEVLVKALVVIASAVSVSAPDSCVQLLLCSHHPFIVGTGKRDAVWKVSFYCLCTSLGIICYLGIPISSAAIRLTAKYILYIW